MNSADPIVIEETVDASGTMCPEPVLRATQALKGLTEGQTLCLIATDPHAELDIEVFCARTGHRLLRQEIQDEKLTFWIQKQRS